MNLTIEEFDDFLKLVFPELDGDGNLIGEDEFKTIRFLFISMVKIIMFGKCLFFIVI